MKANKKLCGLLLAVTDFSMSQAFSETAAGRVQNVILGSQGFSQETDSVLQPQGYLMMSGPKDMIRGLLWQPSCSSWESELSWGCSSVGEPNEASSAWSHRFDYMALLCPSLLDAASAAMTSRHSRKTALGSLLQGTQQRQINKCSWFPGDRARAIPWKLWLYCRRNYLALTAARLRVSAGLAR